MPLASCVWVVLAWPGCASLGPRAAPPATATAAQTVDWQIHTDELDAIDVCHDFVEAQIEYAISGSTDGTDSAPSRDSTGSYSLSLIADESPQHRALHPGVATHTVENFLPGDPPEHHGYHFRMLYRQGDNADGGEREYLEDGLLIYGFALVAWPTHYGASGVMTFIVDLDGVVFQKDLGTDTQAIAGAMYAFDPDESWAPIIDSPEPQGEALPDMFLATTAVSSANHRNENVPHLPLTGGRRTPLG